MNNKRKFIPEYRHPYSTSFISRKLGQREYLSLPFITVITQLCPVPVVRPCSTTAVEKGIEGRGREEEEEEKGGYIFFLFFLSFSLPTSIPREHVCPRLSRRLTVFTFLQRLTTLSSLYARNWRRDTAIFRTKRAANCEPQRVEKNFVVSHCRSFPPPLFCFY